MRQIKVMKRKQKNHYLKPFALESRTSSSSNHTLQAIGSFHRFTSMAPLKVYAVRVISLDVRFELSDSWYLPLHESRSDIRVNSMHHGS